VTVGAAIVTRDGGKDLRALLDQLSHFDQVVVVDTGSRDGTRAYVRKLGAPFELHELRWRPRPDGEAGEDWGLSAAMNEAFRHLTTSHAAWFEAGDEIFLLSEGRETHASTEQAADAFRKMAADSGIAVWMLDDVRRDHERGYPVSVLSRERLLRRDVGWRWRSPVRDALYPERISGEDLKVMRITDVGVSHRSPQTPASTRRDASMIGAWLRAIEKAGAPQAELARARLHHGRSLFAQGRYDRAANWMLGRYLGRHPEIRPEEKWQGWMIAAKSMLLAGDREGARQAALQAIGLCPRFAESYVLLAEIKQGAGERPSDVLKILEIADSCAGEDHGIAERDPSAMTFQAAVIGSECQLAAGRGYDALVLADRAVQARPGDARARRAWDAAAQRAGGETQEISRVRAPARPPSNGEGPDPVFVVSSGRCGSTLVSNMLRLHPDVLSLSEFLIMLSPGAFPGRGEPIEGPQFWALLSTPRKRMKLMFKHGIVFDEVLYRPGPGRRFGVQDGVPPILLTALPHLTDSPDALFDEVREFVLAQGAYSVSEHYSRLFDWLRRKFEKKVWVERSGSILAHFEDLLTNFPNARYVHLFRDGRDCAVSMVSHSAFRLSSITGELMRVLGFDPFNTDRVPEVEVPDRLVPLMPETFDRSAFWSHDVPPAMMGASWNAEEANAVRVLARLPHERVMNLRYESLVANPEAELARLISFIGLDEPTPDYVRQAAGLVRKVESKWPNLPEKQRIDLENSTRFSMGLLYGKMPEGLPAAVEATVAIS